MSSKLVNRDADMAAEMVKFASDQIMLEASTVNGAQAVKSSLNVLKFVGTSLFSIVSNKNRIY